MFRALIILVLGLLSQQTLSKVIPGKGSSLVRVTRSQDAAYDRVMVSRFNSISSLNQVSLGTGTWHRWKFLSYGYTTLKILRFTRNQKKKFF